MKDTERNEGTCCGHFGEANSRVINLALSRAAWQVSICYLKTAVEMNRNGWRIAKTRGVSIPTKTRCGQDASLSATHSTKAFTLLPPPFFSSCVPHYFGGWPWRRTYSQQLNAAAESGFAEGTKDWILFFWFFFLRFPGWDVLCHLSHHLSLGLLMMLNNRRWRKSTLRAFVPPSPWWWLR